MQKSATHRIPYFGFAVRSKSWLGCELFCRHGRSLVRKIHLKGLSRIPSPPASHRQHSQFQFGKATMEPRFTSEEVLACLGIVGQLARTDWVPQVDTDRNALCAPGGSAQQADTTPASVWLGGTRTTRFDSLANSPCHEWTVVHCQHIGTCLVRIVLRAWYVSQT
ncbi:hypothetical protein GGR54DRAFT_414367 [Hypoxylon sp. NC1633]|nr:hypothetical protein GGR54DRAFT_414367 [Hypoxylon sp. NC1633]